jgi:MFS family permease
MTDQYKAPELYEKADADSLVQSRTVTLNANQNDDSSSDFDLVEKGESDYSNDLTAVEFGDLVLQRKIHLVNDAIDEIGFTWFHVKLFCIAGFGYSVDSQMAMVQSAVKTYVDLQMKGGGYPIATEIYFAGLIVGSILFGFGADLIGRKLAFNSSLLLSAIFGFLTGGTSSYAMYSIFMFLSTVSAGGNLATDVAVFLEFLPSKYQYLNTAMALWWGVGQTIASLISWAFIPNNSCKEAFCPSADNRGWRYCWYVNSGIVLGAALMRLVVLKLGETPKFLVSTGRDEEAYEAIMKVARENNRECSLTLEQLKACGEIDKTYFDSKKAVDFTSGLKELWRSSIVNLKILFSSKIVIRSTVLIMVSWAFIGISYSVFYNFLYIYIASHGGNTGSSPYYVYRNSTIANFVGIFGPILGGFLILIPKVGRRGTMIFGSLSAMAILFGYTTVRTPAGDAGFGAATYFFINIYYACLYAYTPEVFPTKARATGVAICLVADRIAGAFAPVTYWYGEKSGSSVPIWVCGAIVGCLSILAFFMPFEPSKKRSV